MLEEARGGRSGALVIRGDAGIGKSTLLEYAVAQASEARVVRALGVETESEFAYSGLHELVRPLLAWLPELPPVQADAMRGALSVSGVIGTSKVFGSTVAGGSGGTGCCMPQSGNRRIGKCSLGQSEIGNERSLADRDICDPLAIATLPDRRLPDCPIPTLHMNRDNLP